MGRKNTPEMFWALVAPTDPAKCWPWPRGGDWNGYGQFNLDGRKWRTHKLAYVLAKGPVPDGLVLDHLCRNRICCNPSHLEPVTQKVNNLRGVGVAPTNASRTHCNNGHEFTPENTGFKEGFRFCRTCANQRKTAYRAERRRRIMADPSLAPHGKAHTYTYWGCLCEPCRLAANDYARERYHARGPRA